jgi:hypothetical protein
MSALQTLATQGSHWMLTPYRTLTLVHAVQQPLQTPEYAALQAQKTLGDTFATVVDAMPIHGKSTNKLDVLATWSEPIDALSDPKWKLVDGNAHVGEMGIEYDDTTANISMKHEFHDTKYRRVTYSAVATTRYKEYFQQAASETFVLPDGAAQPLAQSSLSEHAETVAMADGSVRFERDVDYTMDYAAGTITRIAGGAIPSGASVKVDYYYLPGPTTRETVTPVSVDVLNSARPAAPVVLVENIIYQDAHLVGPRQARVGSSNAALRAALGRLGAAGVRGLYHVPAEGLLGEDGEATVDGTHATDLGFTRLADALEPVLRSAGV